LHTCIYGFVCFEHDIYNNQSSKLRSLESMTHIESLVTANYITIAVNASCRWLL